jgi:hypothetical protein
MSTLRSFVAIGAALAALLAACGDDNEAERVGVPQALAAQRAVDHQLFWVGERFDGLPLTSIDRTAQRTTFAYGTCKQPRGEGGCAPPLQVQTASLCDDNALKLAVGPRTTFAARGTTVRDYGEGRLDLDAATSLVRVFGTGARGRRAVAALRPVDGPARPAARLPAARYPKDYLEQLRRVRGAYARGGTYHAVRAELGISVSAARFELGLARELGRAGLRAERAIACDRPV